jgi:dTDP-4-dehydrorhamnose reductase
MRVLIVGCNGLLGQNLLRTAPSGHSLIGIARHPKAVLSERLGAYHARDITDPATWEFVRDVLKPDFIFNAAAYTDVDGCERDPDTARRVNRDAVRAMAQTGIPLVHLSTDYVFDGAAGPYSEEDAVDPISAYGRIKLESETEALAGSPKNLVVRTMWVWGHAKATEGGAKKSFTDFVRETLAAGKPARIVSDQIGNPTLAEDLALAVWVLVGSGCSGVYHVSGSDRVSRLDWARTVARFYGLDDADRASLITPVTTADLGLPAARPLQSGLRGDKLERDTGLVLGGLEAQLEDHRAHGGNRTEDLR